MPTTSDGELRMHLLPHKGELDAANDWL